MPHDATPLWTRILASVRTSGDDFPVLPRSLAYDALAWFDELARQSNPGLVRAAHPVYRTRDLRNPHNVRVLGLRAGQPLTSDPPPTPFDEWTTPALQLQVGLGCRFWAPAATEVEAWRRSGRARELDADVLALGPSRDDVVLPEFAAADDAVFVSTAVLLPSDRLSRDGRRPPVPEWISAMNAIADDVAPAVVLRGNGGVSHPNSSYLYVAPSWVRLPTDPSDLDGFLDRLGGQIAQQAERIGVFAADRDAWRDHLAALGWDLSRRPVPMAPPRETDRPLWLVGARWSEGDQVDRFLEQGIWEHDAGDQFADQVRAMRPGDPIALKATTNQRNDLPFDNRDLAGKRRTVSKMIVKARGVVTHNPGDGRRVEVDWDPEFEAKDWYFYVYQPTIWRVEAADGLARQLRAFVLEDTPQDYEHFVAHWHRTQWKTDGPRPPDTGPESAPYGVDEMLDEGVFLETDTLERALRLLRKKRNLVLQGAPGTGKTFLARKLAYALLGEKAPDRVVMVQFHPSTSYEDLVRGLRPTETGGFSLQDGPFLELLARAREDGERDYVLIVDEINRGDLSQILGELFQLLEADKRGPEHAVTPLYRRPGEGGLWVPENVYVIGTMNIADRSLALVDFALRRRFAFLTLRPCFDSSALLGWLSDRNLPVRQIDRIRDRMGRLNQLIRECPTLGAAFEVGHSFFCSPDLDADPTGDIWLTDVLETEILPLLEEYWHDDAARLAEARDLLLPEGGA